MESAIVVDTKEVKKILAEHFGVDEKQVIKSQYSWTIIGATKNQLSCN